MGCLLKLNKGINVNRINNIIELHQTLSELKELTRSGWLKWHIKRDRLESVADHIYGVMMLAIVIDSEFNLDLEINKVLKMALLHELEEIEIGDITPYDGQEKLTYKQDAGYQAAVNIINKLNKNEQYQLIIDEYYQNKTKEAQFVHRVDKLEAILQANIYKDDCDVNADENQQMLNKVRHNGIDVKNDDRIVDLFIKNSLQKNHFDQQFLGIIKQLQDNNRDEIK